MCNTAAILLLVVAASLLPPQASSLWWPWRSKKPSSTHFEDFERETGLDQLGRTGQFARRRVVSVGSVNAERSGNYRRSEDDIEPLIVATKYNYHEDHDDDFVPDRAEDAGYSEGETEVAAGDFELPRPVLNAQLDGKKGGEVIGEDGIVDGVERLGEATDDEAEPLPVRRKRKST